jgi:NTE family protein
MTNQMALMALEKHTPDILVNVSRDVCGIFEFFKAEEMVDVGRQAAQMSIKAYLNKTKAFS